ncbi:MAG: HD-GYP domain-containing protein [Pirellulaceae bacterium]
MTATNRNLTERVRVEALIDGRKLQHPIYDDNDVLLLAPGTVITTDVKRRLLARKMSRVIVNVADAAGMTLQGPRPARTADSSSFDTRQIKRLTAIIDAGDLFTADSGRQTVVLHGCKAYDPKHRDELRDRHHKASVELDSMMKRAMWGEKIDARQLSTRVGRYVADLTADPDILLAMATTLGQDASLTNHCLQTTIVGLSLGLEMGLDPQQLRNLGLCGLLHDWGMIQVPKAIRSAARWLTDVEFMQVMKHPRYTLKILNTIQGIPDVVRFACYQMHERPNGTGYPRGFSHHSIHLFARIMRVADTYVALTSPRPQRPPLMPYSAMECLVQLAVRQDVDPVVVRLLLQILSLFPIASFVVLDDGTTACVLRRSQPTHYTTPIVQLLADNRGNPFDPEHEDSIVDLSTHERRIVRAYPAPDSNEIGLRADVLEMGRSPV